MRLTPAACLAIRYAPSVCTLWVRNALEQLLEHRIIDGLHEVMIETGPVGLFAVRVTLDNSLQGGGTGMGHAYFVTRELEEHRQRPCRVDAVIHDEKEKWRCGAGVGNGRCGGFGVRAM